MMRWFMLILLVGLTGRFWFHPAPPPPERALEDTANRALTAYLGRGQFELAVNLKIDRSVMSRTVKDVGGPETTVLMCSQTARENYLGDDEDQYCNDKASNRWETDEIVEKSMRREPEVKGIHAVVVLHRPADKGEVAEVVSTALGVQPERGDDVLVVDSQAGPRPRLMLVGCLAMGCLLGLAAGRRMWYRTRRDWV